MSTGTPNKKQNKQEMPIWISILRSNLLLWDLSLLWCNSGSNYIGTAFVVALGQILPPLGLEQTWIKKCRCSPIFYVHITPVNWFYWMLWAHIWETLCFECPLLVLPCCTSPFLGILRGPRGPWRKEESWPEAVLAQPSHWRHHGEGMGLSLA